VFTVPRRECYACLTLYPYFEKKEIQRSTNYFLKIPCCTIFPLHLQNASAARSLAAIHQLRIAASQQTCTLFFDHHVANLGVSHCAQAKGENCEWPLGANATNSLFCGDFKKIPPRMKQIRVSSPAYYSRYF